VIRGGEGWIGGLMEGVVDEVRRKVAWFLWGGKRMVLRVWIGVLDWSRGGEEREEDGKEER
jgi:hypothetical protein